MGCAESREEVPDAIQSVPVVQRRLSAEDIGEGGAVADHHQAPVSAQTPLVRQLTNEEHKIQRRRNMYLVTMIKHGSKPDAWPPTKEHRLIRPRGPLRVAELESKSNDPTLQQPSEDSQESVVVMLGAAQRHA